MKLIVKQAKYYNGQKRIYTRDDLYEIRLTERLPIPTYTKLLLWITETDTGINVRFMCGNRLLLMVCDKVTFETYEEIHTHLIKEYDK